MKYYYLRARVWILIMEVQIGGGVLSDCWRADERGAATALYSVMPFLGPAVAPIGK